MVTPTSAVRLGQVVALTIRPVKKAAPVGVHKVNAVQGQGLAGDIHADALSPRQILIASRQAYQSLGLPFNSLRENLLVDFDTSSLVSGTVLQVGKDVRLWLTFQCEACGHLNNHSPNLSRVIKSHRGILARVLTGGVIQEGDTVTTLGRFLAEWSDDWRHRIARILNAVPDSAVVEYKQLARLAGVPSSYCRVFPRFIKTLGVRAASKAVPMSTSSSKPRWHGEDFFDVALDYQGTTAKEPVAPNIHHLRITTMDHLSAENLSSEIVRSLSQAASEASTVVQLGQSKVLFTTCRKLKSTNTSSTEPKPYPKSTSVLPDDYDSWLS